MQIPGWKSLLFVPANDSARLAKVASRGADAIILDLEDAVAAEARPSARLGLGREVEALSPSALPVVVRINALWRDALADLDAAVISGVRAIMVPKVQDAERLRILSEMVSEFERERSLPIGGIGFVALIESPGPLAALADIAGVPRVIGLAFGPEDYSLEAGIPAERNGLDLPCRLIALAAAPRRLMALAVPFSIAAYREENAFREASEMSRGFGATGALCIHPSQVRIANAAFAPTESERRAARAVVDAWTARPDQSAGVVSVEGRMVDLPVYLRSLALLETRP